MISVFGQKAPSLGTVEHWHLQFKRGDFGLDDVLGQIPKLQSKIWVFDVEEQPTKSRKSISVCKRIKSVILAGQKTQVHGPVKSQLFEVLSNRRPILKVSSCFLYNNNALAHTAGATTAYLTAAGIKVLEHPSYNPDLASCYFGLFPYDKIRMKRVFSNRRAANKRVRRRMRFNSFLFFSFFKVFKVLKTKVGGLD
ncbi:unnamed protein product, partial [Brenthis ino]